MRLVKYLSSGSSLPPLVFTLTLAAVLKGAAFPQATGQVLRATLLAPSTGSAAATRPPHAQERDSLLPHPSRSFMSPSAPRKLMNSLNSPLSAMMSGSWSRAPGIEQSEARELCGIDRPVVSGPEL